MGMEEEKLNRCRRDRLNKAAKQGYGPWAAINTQSRPSESSSRARHPLAAVSEHAPRAPLMRQQRQATFRKGLEDEPDLDGFLAPKPPGAAQKKAQGHTVSIQAPTIKQPVSTLSVASRLDVRISSGPNERALAASAGARPKAAAKALGSSASHDLTQRQLEEVEHVQMPAGGFSRQEEVAEGATREEAYEEESNEEYDDEVLHAKREPQEVAERDEERDRYREERRLRQREEKRKREEWRKAWREEKRRRDREQSRPGRDGEEEITASEESSDQVENPKNRALTWSMLNNSGVTTARDAQRKYVGQISDADLDRRLREQEVSAHGQKLMSEAEVLAKLQRNRGKANKRR